MSVALTRTSLGQVRQRPTGKSGGVRPALFYLVIGALFLTNALTLVGFAMSRDIARIWSGQNDLVLAGYETRIADLRAEVDKLYSRQYARAGDINLQLQDLMQQQDALNAQHQYVKALAEMAQGLGLSQPLTTAGITPTAAPQPAARKADRLELSSVRSDLENMRTDTDQAMAVLETNVEASTDKLMNGLDRLGLSPALANPASAQQAMGGPFEPAPGETADPMLAKANALYEQFLRFQSAREALRAAPVHTPLKGRMRISSQFGPRSDPFLQSAAFHSGMDFPKPTGTPVLAAAGGRITYAGRQSGYGNLIEITHRDGLKTRYGHLSAILVANGQGVSAGQIIGKVGSTGRSTGPHLHFEVRRNGKPINPSQFLRVGRSLSAFL